MNKGEKYTTTENIAYSKLFDYIRLELFQKPQVIKLTDLMEKLIASTDGISVKESTKTHFRRKLESEFEDTL